MRMISSPQQTGFWRGDFWLQALAVWVWGMAVGLLLWASGVDLAIQWWLFENYHQGFNDWMRVLSTLGKGGTQAGICLALGLILALWLRRWRGAPRMVLLAVPVFLAAGICNIVLKFVSGRPRPKEILMHGGDAWAWQPFSTDSLWWSFPSGHACSTWAIAVWLGLCFPR
ncbi:MAG: phosphatase PAP2 family protein, partial [Proteobacteria bacterium]|nr:phosphatase PAP2 family protein [Pseudomonadota bacterium]